MTIELHMGWFNGSWDICHLFHNFKMALVFEAYNQQSIMCENVHCIVCNSAPIAVPVLITLINQCHISLPIWDIFEWDLQVLVNFLGYFQIPHRANVSLRRVSLYAAYVTRDNVTFLNKRRPYWCFMLCVLDKRFNT